MIRDVFGHILEAATRACLDHYRERLISLAVFGSVGRGTPRPDSDLDLLLVLRELPSGRPERAAEFRPVETMLAGVLKETAAQGVHVELSPVFKTPDEVLAGSPLMLDMVEDARIVHDRDRFLEHALSAFAARLQRLGAKRIWKGSAWIWDLKPDYKPGEVFEI